MSGFSPVLARLPYFQVWQMASWMVLHRYWECEDLWLPSCVRCECPRVVLILQGSWHDVIRWFMQIRCVDQYFLYSKLACLLAVHHNCTVWMSSMFHRVQRSVVHYVDSLKATMSHCVTTRTTTNIVYISTCLNYSLCNWVIWVPFDQCVSMRDNVHVDVW